MSDRDESSASWTLLTGHGHVLVEIARNPDARIRDISAVVGLTDRTVQAIVADLEDAGYLTRTRTGRRTRYTVDHDSLFRHSAQEGLRVGPFLELLAATGGAPAAGPPPGSATTAGVSGPAINRDPAPAGSEDRVLEATENGASEAAGDRVLETAENHFPEAAGD
jgi:MarR family